jgi:hypothetical protein
VNLLGSIYWGRDVWNDQEWNSVKDWIRIAETAVRKSHRRRGEIELPSTLKILAKASLRLLPEAVNVRFLPDFPFQLLAAVLLKAVCASLHYFGDFLPEVSLDVAAARHGLSLTWSKSFMLTARASAHSSKYMDTQEPKAETSSFVISARS